MVTEKTFFITSYEPFPVGLVSVMRIILHEIFDKSNFHSPITSLTSEGQFMGTISQQCARRVCILAVQIACQDVAALT